MRRRTSQQCFARTLWRARQAASRLPANASPRLAALHPLAYVVRTPWRAACPHSDKHRPEVVRPALAIVGFAKF